VINETADVRHGKEVADDIEMHSSPGKTRPVHDVPTR